MVVILQAEEIIPTAGITRPADQVHAHHTTAATEHVHHMAILREQDLIHVLATTTRDHHPVLVTTGRLQGRQPDLVTMVRVVLPDLVTTREVVRVQQQDLVTIVDQVLQPGRAIRALQHGLLQDQVTITGQAVVLQVHALATIADRAAVRVQGQAIADQVAVHHVLATVVQAVRVRHAQVIVDLAAAQVLQGQATVDQAVVLALAAQAARPDQAAIALPVLQEVRLLTVRVAVHHQAAAHQVAEAVAVEVAEEDKYNTV